MSLRNLGWNDEWEGKWQHQKGELDAGWVPARVVAQQKKFWRIVGEFGECWAEVAGRMHFENKSSAALPLTGDWVAAAIRQAEGRGTIHGLLPRRSCFSRKAAGKRTDEQVLAANVDTAFVVTSLNLDLNPRRLERYLALVWESGATPVVLLNKADLCDARAEGIREVESVAIGVAVHAVSAATGENLEELMPYFAEGQTVALLGSSGTGKSTLVNRLMGREVQAVREIREDDDRGRHATTARELFALPGGGLILDTPGMRELQLWDAGEGLDHTFADIAALAAQCRFRDCSHQSEPGCAVRAALENGELDAERLESLRKLEAEEKFQLRKIDGSARQAERLLWRKLHRELRAKYEQRRKEGQDK